MGYDPIMAARSVAEFAAMTDDQMAADIRADLEAVLTAWAAWRSSNEYPRTGPRATLARDREALMTKVTEAYRGLPAGVDLAVLVKVSTALLNPAWGLGPASERPVAEAVELLRRSAIHRPSLVRECRAIARTAGVDR
jgi:hypothetical protein